MQGTREHVTETSEDTLAVGQSLGGELRQGDIVLLRGDLGAGKTVLARGIALARGVKSWQGSPSFALIHEYQTGPPLHHIDLYRVTAGEVPDLGIEEYAGNGILVVEWPERAEDLWERLKTSRLLDVSIDVLGDERRVIRVREAAGATGA